VSAVYKRFGPSIYSSLRYIYIIFPSSSSSFEAFFFSRGGNEEGEGGGGAPIWHRQGVDGNEARRKGRVVGHKSSRSGSISSDTGRLGTHQLTYTHTHTTIARHCARRATLYSLA
jgi:hypothetical protein